MVEVAATHPQATYATYLPSYQQKLTYFLQATPNIEEKLKKIDEVVRRKLIPTIIWGHIASGVE